MFIPRIIALTIGFIAGIVAATFLEIESDVLQKFFLVVCFSGIAYSGWTIYGEYRWKEYSRLLVFLPLLCAGIALGLFRASNVINAKTPAVKFFKALQADEKIAVRGKIIAEPELRSSRTLQLRVRISQIKKVADEAWLDVPAEDIRLMISKPSDEEGKELFKILSSSKAYGYLIQFKTNFTPPREAANPGSFNMKAFLLAEGCIADLKVYDWKRSKKDKGSITDIKPGTGFFLIEWSLAAKRSFIRTYKYAIPPPACRLISGATLGTRFALRGERFRGSLIEESFRHSGVGHVLAVSGLHVSVVALLLFSIFNMTRIPPKYFAPIMILLLFSFTLLTGARPSSLRATIMNTVIILTFVYAGSGFKRATYAGLAIAAFLILLRRPMVLYSAGFLLSFGAVLSLVLISPPLDKILKQLRGAAFGLALIWFVGVVSFASLRWRVFLNWPMIILLFTMLMVMLWLGGVFNRKFPALLKFRFDRIPKILRLFLGAQIAIQFGMMIPMSAYFFGNFPIAGMFVNLIAIPLVGVIVQLGILIGLAGMIPGIGPFFALTLGAANWLAGTFFISVAWLGSVVFPYPPVPKPSPTWIVTYYLVILLLLSVQLWLKKIQALVYKTYTKSPKIIPVFCAIAIILTGSIASYKVLAPATTGDLILDIPAGTSVPVIAISGHYEGAIIINSGNAYFAKRDLKNLLLARGVISMHTAFASGRAPNDGTDGAVMFIEEITTNNFYFPAFPETSDGVLSATAGVDEYAAAIGIKTMSKSKKYWLRNCQKAYAKMLLAVDTAGPPMNLNYYGSPSEIWITKEVKIETLTSVYETYPVPMMLCIRDSRILIIGDPSNRKLEGLSSKQLACDILVLGSPIGSAKYYLPGLKKLLAKIKPAKVIICIDKNGRPNKKRHKVLEQAALLLETSEVIKTDQQSFSQIF